MMPHNESERRDYWSAQLDEAHDFMMRAMDYPVEECGERLVSLPDTANEAGVAVTFCTTPAVPKLKKATERLPVISKGPLAKEYR